MSEEQDKGFELALGGISLTDHQLKQARICWEQSPDGFALCVERALRLERPGGVLVVMLRRDKHLEPVYPLVAGDGFTGWTFVRGSHSGTYVRDPNGRDKVPRGYDLTGYPD